jgi:regulatory protein
VRSEEQQVSAGDDDKTVTRAKNVAYRLLTYRPRSRAELVGKLRDREFEEAVIDRVVSDLERFGYINDRQFAEQWVASRVRLRGLGRRRVEQELRNKGIDRDIVRDVLVETLSLDDEEAVAKQAAERKLRSMRNIEPLARKRRLAGFLERKGFSSEIIRSIIRTVPSRHAFVDEERRLTWKKKISIA